MGAVTTITNTMERIAKFYSIIGLSPNSKFALESPKRLRHQNPDAENPLIYNFKIFPVWRFIPCVKSYFSANSMCFPCLEKGPPCLSYQSQ